MCVIALLPPGVELTHDEATAMWKTNPDGGGFAWLDRHNQWRIKTFMEFKKFWDAYKGTTQGYQDREFLVHFRIGTHGGKTIDNVHPFRLNHNTVVAHNGIIPCVPDYNDGRSDTRVFVEDTLPKLPELWLDSPELRWLVEDAIGASKMVFLSNDPRLSATQYILNKNSGTELDNGTWVSNKLWERNLPGKQTVYAASLGFKTAKQPFSESKAIMDILDEGVITYESEYGTWFEDRNGVHTWKPKGDDTPFHQLPAKASEDRLSKGLNDTLWADKENLERKRGLDGFMQDVTMIDGEWVCNGCWNDLGEEGECLCFEAVCIHCLDYAAYCPCTFDTKDIVTIEEISDDPEKYERFLPDLAALHEDLGWIAHVLEESK